MDAKEYFGTLKFHLKKAQEAAQELADETNNEEADVIIDSIDNTISKLQEIRDDLQKFVDKANKEGLV